MHLPAVITFATYLALFFWAGRLASAEAGRSIWLFGMAQGRARLAAIGFRAGFTLSGIGVLAALFGGQDRPAAALEILGLVLCNIGAMLAFAAQLSMGASWRVGVQPGALGPLVSGGLYRYSRNPTFLGQGLLLLGMASTAPNLLTVAGAILFAWSAKAQVSDEEIALSAQFGADYSAFMAQVPRWFGRRS